MKKITEAVGKNVFTSDGDYFGQIEDVNLAENKVDGWKVKISSNFTPAFGGARGVVIPHQVVRAMGDVVIVNKNALPSAQTAMSEPLEVTPQTEE